LDDGNQASSVQHLDPACPMRQLTDVEANREVPCAIINGMGLLVVPDPIPGSEVDVVFMTEMRSAFFCFVYYQLSIHAKSMSES